MEVHKHVCNMTLCSWDEHESLQYGDCLDDAEALIVWLHGDYSKGGGTCIQRWICS